MKMDSIQSMKMRLVDPQLKKVKVNKSQDLFAPPTISVRT